MRKALIIVSHILLLVLYIYLFLKPIFMGLVNPFKHLFLSILVMSIYGVILMFVMALFSFIITTIILSKFNNK
jgi:hypothetical protein